MVTAISGGPGEITMYQCKACGRKTANKANAFRHFFCRDLLRHKAKVNVSNKGKKSAEPDEITMPVLLLDPPPPSKRAVQTPAAGEGATRALLNPVRFGETESTAYRNDDERERAAQVSVADGDSTGGLLNRASFGQNASSTDQNDDEKKTRTPSAIRIRRAWTEAMQPSPRSCTIL